MSAARKKWTRDYLLFRLFVAQEAMEQAIKVAENGGRMPLALRKRVVAECKRIRATTGAIQIWAMTPGEKAIKEVKRKKVKTLMEAQCG